MQLKPRSRFRVYTPLAERALVFSTMRAIKAFESRGAQDGRRMAAGWPQPVTKVQVVHEITLDSVPNAFGACMMHYPSGVSGRGV